MPVPHWPSVIGVLAVLTDIQAGMLVFRINPESDEFVDRLQQDIGDDPAVDSGKENGLGLVEKLRGAPG